MSEQEMKDIVVVTGYKRSGTSLMMRILKEIGYEPVVCQELEEKLLSTVPKNEYFLEHIDHVYKGFEDGEVEEGKCVKVLSIALDKIPKNCKVIFMYRDTWSILESLKEYKTDEEMKFEEEMVQGYLDYLVEFHERFPDGMLIHFEDLIQEPEMVLKGGRFEKLIGREVCLECLKPLIWKK